jgi:hypothetical protein
MKPFVSAILVLSMLAISSQASAQCAKDTDCKGNRICQKGECVEVVPAVSPSAVVAPTVPAPAALPVLRSPSPRNVISTNPLDIISGSIGVQYERVFARFFSLAIGVSFYDSDMDPINSSDVNVIGGGVTLQPRVYLLRRGAPRGLYLSPVVSVFYLSAGETDMTYAVSGAGYSVGGLVGWSWLIGRHFNIKVGLGVQYIHFALTDSDGTVVGAAGVAPLGELTLGLAF